MALTGRLALAALLAAFVAAALVDAADWSPRAALVAVNLVLMVAVAVDLALAGSVRALRIQRDGDTRVRLGEPAQVELFIANPGRRRVRARLRDAWPPSAGVEQQRHSLDLPVGERRRITADLLPTRRGDRRADRVTVRSRGPLGLAARQGSHDVPWTVRALPPFTSRKHLPSKLARLRELDGRTAVLVRGPGTEFDSLRTYVAGDDVRSIDWRATARSGGLVVRTWRPERDRQVLLVLDTGRTAAGRVGDARGWTPPWTPRSCSQRWPRRQATEWICWRSTEWNAPPSQAVAQPTCCTGWCRRWRPWKPACRDRLARRRVHGHATGEPPVTGGSPHVPRPGTADRRAAARAAHARRPASGADRVGLRPAHSVAGAWARGCNSGVQRCSGRPDRGRPSSDQQILRRQGVDVVDAPRRICRRSSPTPTSLSKPPAGCDPSRATHPPQRLVARARAMRTKKPRTTPIAAARAASTYGPFQGSSLPSRRTTQATKTAATNQGTTMTVATRSP